MTTLCAEEVTNKLNFTHTTILACLFSQPTKPSEYYKAIVCTSPYSTGGTAKRDKLIELSEQVIENSFLVFEILLHSSVYVNWNCGEGGVLCLAYDCGFYKREVTIKTL